MNLTKFLKMTNKNSGNNSYKISPNPTLAIQMHEDRVIIFAPSFSLNKILMLKLYF